MIKRSNEQRRKTNNRISHQVLMSVVEKWFIYRRNVANKKILCNL